METSIPDDASRLAARRHTMNSHFLSVDEIFTSSLPTTLIDQEHSKFKERRRSHRSLERNMLSAEDDLVEDVEKEGFFQRSFSPKISSPKFQRPRSASMQSQQLTSPGLKKTFRSLSRARPSSARFSRKNSTSLSADQEFSAGTQKVDMAFAKIKSQLAELSAEDMALQERLDHLSAEIAHINRYAAKLKLSCSMQYNEDMSSQKSGMLMDEVFPSPTLVVSGAPNDTISPLSEESWEEDVMNKHHSNELLISPKCFNMRGNPKSGHGNGSLGSCGSLADSEGSVSPITKVPCCIVVVDHDESVKIPREARFYEDDVFLT